MQIKKIHTSLVMVKCRCSDRNYLYFRIKHNISQWKVFVMIVWWGVAMGKSASHCGGVFICVFMCLYMSLMSNAADLVQAHICMAE